VPEPDEPPRPLGSITYRGRSYTFSEDGKWSGPAALVADELNAAFNSDTVRSGSSAATPLGYAVVAAAAKWAGDPNPKLPAFRESTMPPGTIY